MYKFNIVKDEIGGWRFELSGINLIVDEYSIEGQHHKMNNPAKAIAFFNVNGHLYGITNELQTVNTAEELYDKMLQQYLIFKNGSKQALKSVA
jgi:uncharacterized protein YegP (UPF0339 family)